MPEVAAWGGEGTVSAGAGHVTRGTVAASMSSCVHGGDDDGDDAAGAASAVGCGGGNDGANCRAGRVEGNAGKYCLTSNGLSKSTDGMG